ncbi:solute:sodium symporter family transporter [Mucilaginibacter limnophilus]|uniref:Solute:sodium symporter family transporter n=1 Tax=Mucilaginibacter limnophilus TaxID=1932778 RepID=A0A437MYT1_9SPHI|nr:solute:sodium symporter family transporter [Mucilaginibacter limnophilus]RVU02832.1 solute:sodium symporter family transporter [Mucilaginibacter limnophilus]
MNPTVVLSFLLFTFLAALISFVKSSGSRKATTTDFFFANRTNGWLIIGASLFFSNISSNQFIGENESVYINNMSVIGWGVTSVVAMLIVSEYFIPIYMKAGVMTTPDFLEKRYDKSTKLLVSVVFLFSYIINLLPAVLYGGAVAFSSMFNIPSFLGISYWQSIWLLVFIIGIIGGIYSIVGGFKAITISDTVLSICMFMLALIIPYFGLRYLGDGSVEMGFQKILSSKTEHLNAIGSETDAVPFSTLFTGMLIVNLYYWGMEQYIIQQAIAGRSLKDSQKGIALACFAKLLCPLLINIPGLIAVHMYPSLTNTAEVFPTLVKDVLPGFLVGLTASVLLGAAITTYNAGLNSSSTLFVLNLYKPYLEKKKKGDVSERQLLRAGKIFQICISLFAVFFAPFIIFAQHGFYNYLQKVGVLFTIPIFTIIFLGFITKRLPAIAAKVGLVFFIVCYLASQLLMNLKLHFLHVIAIVFVITSVLMLLIGRLYPQPQPYVLQLDNKVDISPWKNRHYISMLLLIIMVIIYLVFSPVMLAG